MSCFLKGEIHRKKVILKDGTIAECLVVFSHVTRLKGEGKEQLIGRKTAVYLFPEAAERVVSRLKAVVQLCVFEYMRGHH